jgi:hypothetical protein
VWPPESLSERVKIGPRRNRTTCRLGHVEIGPRGGLGHVEIGPNWTRLHGSSRHRKAPVEMRWHKSRAPTERIGIIMSGNVTTCCPRRPPRDRRLSHMFETISSALLLYLTHRTHKNKGSKDLSRTAGERQESTVECSSSRITYHAQCGRASEHSTVECASSRVIYHAQYGRASEHTVMAPTVCGRVSEHTSNGTDRVRQSDWGVSALGTIWARKRIVDEG